MALLRYDLSYLENPEIFAVGRMDAFSDHDTYLNEEEADTGESSLHTSLNGRWRFHYAQDLNLLPAGFEAEDYDIYTWDEITVPGHIQLQGYGCPHYVDVMYPWDGHEEVKPPHIPRDNPAGSYVRRFTVPAAWKDMRIILTFHGVEAAFFCWVNGKLMGYAEDSFTPSRFDITDALHEGDNTLAVQVFHFASSSWIEDQDFWRFSGIFRDVQLSAQPKAHVRDIFVHTELNDAFDAADLRTEVKLDLPEEDVMLTAILSDGEGSVVCKQTMAAQKEMELHMAVSSPLLWSAEKPNLYRLRMVLTNAHGAQYEAAQTRVGFRRFEIRDGIMQLNGKRILFRGVNRHEYHPEKGRCISPEEMYADIVTLKRNNINAVRTSHYPNQSLWYRLCDEYGIYLIDEANFESHGTWVAHSGRMMDEAVPKDLPEWQAALIDRAVSMQERDKNHPSILIWSCGNESAGGRVIFEMAEHMRRRDPSRIVHYEGVADDRSYNDTSDVESRMYMSVARIQEWLAEHTEKPFLLCEYSHAMGNSCGALHKYVALEDEFRQYQGGFIWDFLDQALCVTAPNGKPRMAYGGDLDDRPTNREFCGNGILFADRRGTPKLQEVKYLYQPVQITPEASGVMLDNRLLFENTSRYDLCWRLMRDGETVRQGKIEAPDVPAGEKRSIAIELGGMDGKGEYVLHCGLCLREDCFWAEAGYELMHGSAVVKTGTQETAEKKPFRVVMGGFNIGVTDEHSQTIYSMVEGGPVSLKTHGGVELLMTAPKLSFYRAPTDNDVANQGDQDAAFWQAVCTSARGEMKDVHDALIQGVIEYHYDLPFTDGASADVRYTALGGGRVLVNMRYQGTEKLPDMSAFGLSLCMPRSICRVRYYGMGPAENYSDRKHGAYLGVFETDAQSNLTPYLRPQECGNREAVRFVEVTDEARRGIRVDYADAPLSVSVLPYSAEQLRAARHPDELADSCYTFLDIAMKRMGVGGDNTWGAPVHQEYHIPANEDMQFSFILTALS